MIIAIDYLTQYVQVKTCKSVDGKAVIDFFKNFISPNFEYPHSLYINNSSYFVRLLVADFFTSKGI